MGSSEEDDLNQHFPHCSMPYKSAGNLVHKQTLLLWAWAGTRDSSVLTTSSQVMLMLLVTLRSGRLPDGSKAIWEKVCHLVMNFI